MSKTTTVFFGLQAEMFLKSKHIKITKIKKLDRERTAVEITFEAKI